MLKYEPFLKGKSRSLRSNMTDSEQAFWFRIRRKQLLGIQFYRQKPIGGHIVDFNAPKVGIVIEIDGSQHRSEEHEKKDQRRDAFLRKRGLEVLRFNSREVLLETDSVVAVIYQCVATRVKG